MTFQELWGKLEKYSQFFIYSETTGFTYDGIYVLENGKFLIDCTDENMFSLELLPDAELKEIRYSDNSLVFTIYDNFEEQDVELFLQIRQAPDVEI